MMDSDSQSIKTDNVNVSKALQEPGNLRLFVTTDDPIKKFVLGCKGEDTINDLKDLITHQYYTMFYKEDERKHVSRETEDKKYESGCTIKTPNVSLNGYLLPSYGKVSYLLKDGDVVHATVEEPRRLESEAYFPKHEKLLKKESVLIRSEYTIKRKRGRPSRKPVVQKEPDEEPEDKDFRRILSPRMVQSSENSKVDWILGSIPSKKVKKVEDPISLPVDIAPEPSVQSAPIDSNINTISSPSVAAQLSEDKLIRKNLKIQNSDSKDGDDERSPERSPSDGHDNFQGNNFHEGFPDWSTGTKLPEKGRSQSGQSKDWEIKHRGGETDRVYRLLPAQNLLTEYFMTDKRFYNENSNEIPFQKPCDKCALEALLAKQKSDAPKKRGLRANQDSTYRTLGYDIGLRDLPAKLEVCRDREEAKAISSKALGREDLDSMKGTKEKDREEAKHKDPSAVNFKRPFSVRITEPRAKESKNSSKIPYSNKENLANTKSHEGSQKESDDFAKYASEYRAADAKQKLKKPVMMTHRTTGTQCPHQNNAKSTREETTAQLQTIKKRRLDDDTSESEEEWTVPKTKKPNTAKNTAKPDSKYLSISKEP